MLIYLILINSFHREGNWGRDVSLLAWDYRQSVTQIQVVYFRVHAFNHVRFFFINLSFSVMVYKEFYKDKLDFIQGVWLINMQTSNYKH